MVRIILGAVAAVMAGTFTHAIAQTDRPVKPSAVQTKPAAGMSNADVIELVKAGFSDELVIARIQQVSKRSFDLSTKALVSLKQAGISERVIVVMMGNDDVGKKPSVTATPPVVPVPPQVVTQAPPSAAVGREAGIYLATASNMTPLEPSVFSGGKSGGVFMSAMTGGLKKTQWKAVVRSPRAMQRVQTTTPEFYFYFERTSSGLGNTGLVGAMLGASSPNEFVLVRMTEKKNERELVIGEAGAFSVSSGTRSKDTVDMTIERLQPGVYKVTSKFPLTPGEYCFFYAGGASTFMAAGAGKLFDFGVDAGSEASK